MSEDKLILVAVVAGAALLVASKKGMFKKAALTSGGLPSFQGGFFAPADAERGYDPANPGAYVAVEDLIAGVADNDWSYTPSRFEQTGDDVLSNAGFWQPGYYRVVK